MDQVDELIRVGYRVRADRANAQDLARAIALEQTVELPENQLDEAIREEVMGEVQTIENDPVFPGCQRVRIAYRAGLAGGGLGVLFNLLYGNVSMYPGVRLLDVDLPDSLLAEYPGPRYGIAGVRGLLGVHGRPLLATALKPRGSPIERLASMAEAFALGGGDIVKDDQNLADADLDAFRRRVDACAVAVERANERTGRRCLYLPHLAGPDGSLEKRAEFIRARGLAGALVCPLLVGLDRARSLARDYDLLFMAHPALSGVYTQDGEQGVAHHLLLGTLFRLAGVDISVFPAPGGRFDVDAEQCGAIAKALTRPLGKLSPAFPAPAGGMRLDTVEALVRAYGRDSVWLVGGALHGHAGGVAGGTRAFLEALRERFDERVKPPAEDFASACELPSSGRQAIQTLIAARDDFRWQGRDDQVYKTTQELGFRGVRRVELVGRHGEEAGFELRYFELEPDGYTSLEKHVHTHVLIGARGEGVLVAGEARQILEPNDVAYVAPLEVHQLRNESGEPFGFYCIVDRERDRPMPP
ncbi:MAG: RuBisCO large subunit C-terminal-like domain-containing protein [Gammaproteobacteria bacterium]|nr:RuBisCO large subunit C-terminal-like domain-containing protein [Gammaproteobacteria bacterium]